ncbi:MAG: radical SAM protein [Candidatus Kuenenia sp.]|nr:radical SAM protein [Candidatus Kuenenia sp.]
MDIGLGTRKDFIHFGNLKPKKIFNIYKKVFSTPRPILNYFPLSYYIDLSTICNLRCLHCFQREFDSDKHIKRQFMKYEDFLKILEKIKDYALILHLYNWGESLLNPDALKIIRAAYDCGIRSRISSNIAMRMSDEYVEGIIESGLYRLTCSIDGPTQEIYGKYRVDGDIEQVINNARRILAVRKKRSVKYPFIVYRMLVFEWNHEYIEQSRNLAKEIGFDGFYTYPGTYNRDGEEVLWDMDNRRWKSDPGRRSGMNLVKAKTPCHWLFNSMVLTANGRSLACCTIPELAAEGPSLIQCSLNEVWNSEGYVRSREYSLGLTLDRSKVMYQCKKCADL